MLRTGKADPAQVPVRESTSWIAAGTFYILSSQVLFIVPFTHSKLVRPFSRIDFDDILFSFLANSRTGWTNHSAITFPPTLTWREEAESHFEAVIFICVEHWF